jgi:hypothetical protein
VSAQAPANSAETERRAMRWRLFVIMDTRLLDLGQKRMIGFGLRSRRVDERRREERGYSSSG